MNSAEIKSRPKLLVAIASYGERNPDQLKTIIREYRQMDLDARIVVLSNIQKDVGPGAEVLVGLPSKNPWSLPFAHKQLFAENADRYDLFLYSEDDILVTEANIRAFREVTPSLADDEVAGFLHFEKDAHGNIWMVCVHRHFHWKAGSVRKRGNHTVAEFSNEHSACFLLTQVQLKKAIASGGFLREPYEGQYDMLCTAATDPFTSCGLRKVICISRLEDFLIHHMPNKYVAELDVPLTDFQEQIQTLLRIRDGLHPARELFEIKARFWHFWWQKSYYEKPDEELLTTIPSGASTVLSIGCGWGATESRLRERGVHVTALPLDSVIGETAARRGLEVIHGSWEECQKQIDGRQFDCVLMTDLFHLQEKVEPFVQHCGRLVRRGGVLVAGGPNFNRWQWYLKRKFRTGAFRELRSFDACGINVCGPESLAKHFRQAGFRLTRVKWCEHETNGGGVVRRIPAQRFNAKEWLLQATRMR